MRAAVRITAGDPDWPLGLSELTDPPPFLEMEGAFPRELPTIAIVGTRHATDEALEVAHGIAADLARAGALVISGGAYGIDAAAHEGALSVDAPTVAVLGTPIDRLYPKSHIPLFLRILERGALVSEQPRGGGVRAGMFLARNRLIAAAADVCLVVQAPLQSGALSTAAYAHDLGRPLFSCPWSPREGRAQGGLALLASSRARLARDARDLCGALGLTHAPAKTARRRSGRVRAGASAGTEPLVGPTEPAQPVGTNRPSTARQDPDRARVLAALGRTAARVDALVLKVGLPLSKLLPVLFELELDGEVTSSPSGYRRA